MAMEFRLCHNCFIKFQAGNNKHVHVYGRLINNLRFRIPLTLYAVGKTFARMQIHLYVCR